MDDEQAVCAVSGIGAARFTIITDDYYLSIAPLSRRYYTRSIPIVVWATVVQNRVYTARNRTVLAMFATNSNIDRIPAPVLTVNFELFASPLNTCV